MSEGAGPATHAGPASHASHVSHVGDAGISLRDWLPTRLRQIATMVAFDLVGPLTLYAVLPYAFAVAMSLRTLGYGEHQKNKAIAGARIPR